MTMAEKNEDRDQSEGSEQRACENGEGTIEGNTQPFSLLISTVRDTIGSEAPVECPLVLEVIDLSFEHGEADSDLVGSQPRVRLQPRDRL
jgi:hypothetical protein